MNFLQVTKAGDRILFGNGQSAFAEGALSVLPDGRYSAGFRPNHLEVVAHAGGTMSFDTRLVVTEMTGSETFVHLDYNGETWVGLVHGIHDLKLGVQLKVYLDPRHVYIFSEAGDLVAPASYALAA